MVRAKPEGDGQFQRGQHPLEETDAARAGGGQHVRRGVRSAVRIGIWVMVESGRRRLPVQPVSRFDLAARWPAPIASIDSMRSARQTGDRCLVAAVLRDDAEPGVLHHALPGDHERFLGGEDVPVREPGLEDTTVIVRVTGGCGADADPDVVDGSCRLERHRHQPCRDQHRAGSDHHADPVPRGDAPERRPGWSRPDRRPRHSSCFSREPVSLRRPGTRSRPGRVRRAATR